MKRVKRHIVVVCGYGCHLRDPEGRPTPLKPYLYRVSFFINRHDPELAIFCGGHTQHKSAPGVSEAGLMSSYLDHNQMVLPDKRTEFRSESNSYTTYENIRNAAAATRNWVFHHARGEKLRVTIFCEATRAPHVIRFARHFMVDLVDSIDDITVETASWERDVNLFKLAWKYVLAEVAIRFPWLGLVEHEHRRRVWRSQFI